MNAALRLTASCLTAILLAGCATTRDFPAVEQQALAAERQHIAQVALSSWEAQRIRLYSVREKLWQTATQRGECGKTQPDRGILLESIGDLPSALRKETLETGLREQDQGLTILAVIPDAPATLAGLRAGDRLIAAGASHAAVHDELPAGWFDTADLALDIKNSDGNQTVRVGSRSLCAYDIRLENTHAIDAGFDGSTIHISQGMLQALPDDASLAFVLAHELGHAASGHSSLTSMLNPVASRNQEREADLIGIRLTAHAGYDLATVASIWDRLAQLDPNRVGPAWLNNHPSDAERKLRLQAAIAELQAEKVAESK
jgi:hypothetical protein